MRKNDNFQTSPRRAAPDVYLEGLTRTNVTEGPIWMTFTPLLGASEVVRRFLIEKSPDRHITQIGISEAEHFTLEQRDQIIHVLSRA